MKKPILFTSLLLCFVLTGCAQLAPEKTEQPAKIEIKKNEEKTLPEVTETTKESKVVQPDEATGETADWETYVNEEYAFKFKYPRDWSEPIGSGPPSPAEGVLHSYLLVTHKGVSQPSTGVIITNTPGLEIYIFRKNSGGPDYEGVDDGVGLALRKDYNPKKCPAPVTEVMIGKKDCPAKIVYAPPTNKCFREEYFYILQKGEYNYVLTPIPQGGAHHVGYDGEVEVKKSLPEFFQILSTFEFID